jgi:TRAP-type mannitol/chloroaromatic compound transport system permease small subunit
MKGLFKAIDVIALILYWISGALLVAMMLTVVVDVACRALFDLSDETINWTFIGGIEVVKYCLLFSMLCAFPYAVDKGQIVVDLFTQRWSAPALRWVDGFYTAMLGVLGALLSWRFFIAGEEAALSGELTQDLLLPLEPIYTLAAIALSVLALRGVCCALKSVIYPRDLTQEVHP